MWTCSARSAIGSASRHLPVSNRPELVRVRNTVIRYFHLRASLDEVRDTATDAAKSMMHDGLTMEEILVVLKGAVSLASEHVSHTSTGERASWLKSQITPWLVALYTDESGELGAPGTE